MTLPYLYRDPGSLPAFVKIYEEHLAKAGHDIGRTDILGKFHIYVSSSLEQAINEAAPYLDNYLDVHTKADLERKEVGLLIQRDAETQIREGFVLAGDPERVADTIRQWSDPNGLTTISGTFHFGGMPQAMALKNIRLFAEKVMPQFR